MYMLRQMARYPSHITTELVSHFSVSPKLNAQGDPLPRRLNVKALQAFAELAAIDRACFKVVA